MVMMNLNDHQQALLSLSRTCKCLHKIATHQIYAYAICNEKCHKGRNVIPLLLRTVLERPELALLIKRVRLIGLGFTHTATWNGHGFSDTCRWGRLCSIVRDYPTKEIFDLASSYTFRTRFGRPRDLLKGSVSEISHMFARLLLLQLPNALSLEIGIDYANGVLQMLGYDAEYLASGRPYTGNAIEELSLDVDAKDCYPENPTNTISKYSIRPLLSFPSLHHLSMRLCYPESAYPTLPVSTAVTTLELHNSVLSEVRLSEVLSFIPYLKHLVLGLWRNPQPAVNRVPTFYDFYDCEVLGQALLKLPRLESIAISVSFKDSRLGYHAGPLGGRWKCGTKGRVGTLRHLRYLKEVKIPLILLLGWGADGAEFINPVDFLPEQLSSLVLTHDLSCCKGYQWLAREISLIISDIICNHRRCSALKSIRTTWNCRRWEEDASIVDWDDLSRQGLGTGVQIVQDIDNC